MANRVKAHSIIKSITFDVTIKGKHHKNITLEYTPEKDWHLEACDVYYEDNDSWQMVELDGTMYDFQIFGEDDSYLQDDWGEFVDRLAFKTRLSCQLVEMRKCEDGKYEHADDWYCQGEGTARFTNVVLHTNDGDKKCKLIPFGSFIC